MPDIKSLLPSGQQTKANSESVVLASDHSPLPVSGPLTDGQLRASAVPVELDERLAMLERAIMRPIWFDPATGTLRFQAVSGTITAVSTVSSVTNQVNIGSVDAKTGFVDELAMLQWNNSIRRCIS